ncbi:MAG TPA: MFS transporter [Candidatus Corynebacterium avicola]|uniref:MFS transporter n=1 Tax=Candidatus Corynebacterium avicola TaxID=2838527 RepID=A0A9D1UL76_9CORY|nr:MFS transporter [Candidatus Corynebacterium avicola]
MLVCASALFLVGLDTSMVTVALPSVSTSLGVERERLAWVVDAYTVPFASLLITAGALADRYGRRRIFRIGLVTVALSSLACAVAPTLEVLVLARALQGVGASMLTPVALAIVVNVMTDPRERALAIGAWGSMFGISLAAGPVTGGALTSAIDWRAVFWVNLPLIALILVLVAVFVPESRAADPRPLDPVGQILLVALVGIGVTLLIEGPHQGWTSPIALVAYPLLVATAAAFIVVETRRDAPLIDLSLARNGPFAAAIVSAVVVFTAFSMVMFLTTMLLQVDSDWSTVAAGAATLPMAVGTVVGAPLSGILVGRTGPRLPLIISGTLIAVAGLCLLPQTLPVLFLAFLLAGAGVGIASAPVTNTAVSTLPADRAGVAGGMTSTARQLGIAFGAALAGSLGVGTVAWTLIICCGAAVVAVAVLVIPRTGATVSR